MGHINFIHRERERGTRRDVYVVDDDAWLQAMLRRDQTYGPMLAALSSAIAGLDSSAPSRHRLVMMKEFLLFVDEEMDALAKRWLRRQRQLERALTRS